MKQLSVMLGLALVLTGCAATIPRSIREPAPGNITVAEARVAGVQLIGNRIRWGGTIAGVENRATDTWIEIVERPLDGDGRPQQTDRTGGRFLAQVPGFLDPSIYANGRDITVSGILLAPQSRKIGEYPYTFPVVKAQQVHLWPRPEPVRRYYYSPFWPDPWYPWGYPFPYGRYY